jgi:hypothetical protein
MHRAKKLASLLPVLLLSLLAVACNDGTLGVEDPTGEALMDTGARIRVLLTDAPSDYIGAAEVDIGRVELVPVDDGPPIVLSEDGTDGFVNLLDLQDAATMPLAEADIEPGAFAQLRLIVEAARVEMIEGYEFRDGSTEMALFVPSGAQTGIKLILKSADDSGPLEIVPGETVLVLDFDVSRSFVLRGNPETPAGVHGVNFKPTIRVTAMDVAGSISGTVRPAEGEGDDVSVGGLTVVAEPVDGGDVVGYQTEAGTAITADDGTYTIHFLVPGTYQVFVETPEGLTAQPEIRTVELGFGENATEEDFEVESITGTISGAVTTELAETSVEGLTVTALSDAEDGPEYTGTTGEDGTYMIGAVLPGSYTVTVEVGEDQVSDPPSQAVEVAADEEVVEVDFEILEDLTGSISGAVSTELEGVSVEGLTVFALPEGEGSEPITTDTAEDGTYTIDSLPAGTYTVTVELGEGFTADPASSEVEVAEDEDVVEVDFAVIESGG